MMNLGKNIESPTKLVKVYLPEIEEKDKNNGMIYNSLNYGEIKRETQMDVENTVNFFEISDLETTNVNNYPILNKNIDDSQNILTEEIKESNNNMQNRENNMENINKINYSQPNLINPNNENNFIKNTTNNDESFFKIVM